MLDDRLREALRAPARREGKSASALAREILAAHLRPRSGLDRIEGVGQGPPDLARNRDPYLE